jgi:hypothetical protein
MGDESRMIANLLLLGLFLICVLNLVFDIRLSFPRRRESIRFFWIPVFAGMTVDVLEACQADWDDGRMNVMGCAKFTLPLIIC